MTMNPEPELTYHRVEIISLRSKSTKDIGDMVENSIIVFCFAEDVRDAIAVVEAVAAEQHVTVDRIKNVVNLEIPLSAHIERPVPSLITKN